MGDAASPPQPDQPPRRNPPTETPHRVAVLVPVKQFSAAKHRLASVLSDAQRALLAQAMVRRVLAAAGGLDAYVVADHPSVLEWASDHGFNAMLTRAAGLNPSVAEAVAGLEAGPHTHALIAHGDLPRASALSGLCRRDAVTIVSDRHRDGTNVMSVPLRRGFRFAYGPGSLHAHTREAFRCGLGVHVRRVPELELDVDNPVDLADAAELLAELGIEPAEQPPAKSDGQRKESHTALPTPGAAA